MAQRKKQTVLGKKSDTSISIRQISNGFIITENTERKGKDGSLDFKSKETFSAERPKVTIG